MKLIEVYHLLLPIMLIVMGFYAKNENTKLAIESPGLHKRWYTLVILGILLFIFKLVKYI